MILNNKRALGYLRGTRKPAFTVELDRLKRKVRRLTPEVKYNNTATTTSVVSAGGFAIYELSAVPQGDDVSQRIGRKIAIYGIDVRIHSTMQSLDSYIILSPNGDTPIAADFENVVGGHLTVSGASTHREMAHVHNYSGANYYSRYRRRFRKPIITKFVGTASTDGDANRVWLVFSNHWTATATVDFSAKIYYRDI